MYRAYWKKWHIKKNEKKNNFNLILIYFTDKETGSGASKPRQTFVTSRGRYCETGGETTHSSDRQVIFTSQDSFCRKRIKGNKKE